MSYTLAATACPAVVLQTTPPPKLKDAANPSGTVSLVQKVLTSALGSSMCTFWNRNAVGSDLAGRYGGGIPAIGYGLAITTDGSMTVTVGWGHAHIDGVVELDVDTAATIGAGGDGRYWLYLPQTGAIYVSAVGSLTDRPTGSHVLLGSVLVTGGVSGAAEYSGVMYSEGGRRRRNTGDAAAPGDTPPAGAVHEVQTTGGLYLWTGTTYVRLDAVSAAGLLSATGLKVSEGSNARMGTAVLVAGAATVATTAVGATSRVYVCSQVDGGTPGWLRVSARTAGTSFTITSSSATDTSTVAWVIIDPA
jgi:hypothetical protein